MDIELGRFRFTPAGHYEFDQGAIAASIVLLACVAYGLIVGWRRDAPWKPALYITGTIGLYLYTKSSSFSAAERLVIPLIMISYVGYAIARCTRWVTDRRSKALAGGSQATPS